MSLDATTWAWRVTLKEKQGGARIPLKRLVLLSLADRAGEDHTCYPSMQRLEKDTGLERKTVLKIIAELQNDNLIADVMDTRYDGAKSGRIYRHEMDNTDHEDLLKTLLGLEGMVMLSGYPCEMYDDMLKGWSCISTNSRISAGRGTGVRTECLWMNKSAQKPDLFGGNCDINFSS